MIAFAATLLVVSLEVPRTFDALITNSLRIHPVRIQLRCALLHLVRPHQSLSTLPAQRHSVDHHQRRTSLHSPVLRLAAQVPRTSFVSLFSTKAGAPRVTSFEQLQSLFVIYGVGWMFIFLLVAWLYHRAYSTRESLALTPVEAYDAITASRHYLGFVAAGAVSVLLALSGIGTPWGLPGIAYVTIGLFAWLNVTRARARSQETCDHRRKPPSARRHTRHHGIRYRQRHSDERPQAPARSPA